MGIFGKIVLALGILGILLGIAVTGISAILPIATDGRTSWEEAMIGIVPGAAVLVLSFFVAVIGIVVIFIARKNKAQ
ncbi:MAG: hypothetical protein DWQ47_14980 [Acidobacteria bacterium]|nr:MAG: hypothetical protein DWQ32_02380 [Acidobacteriota bacterium]REK02631.1 MAG: hypothetical protein DWQ38_09755 [Acidobacteriota bacterium]REK13565.1 MAG: hypothetical protein DWQ43_08070 [Acidobacteriota bacterium]REK41559.1 MAG: hypothetical protein DWQ47_14980 [Acidobacteriota bacterium]